MTKNLHLVIWNDKSQCYNFYIKKMSNIKKKTALRQKPTNYIIRNKAKYVKQNRVNTDTYLPTISLICRCFSKVIKTVNIRFMLACVPLSSNWKGWTTANVVSGEQKMDSLTLSCEAVFRFAKKYKKE